MKKFTSLHYHLLPTIYVPQREKTSQTVQKFNFDFFFHFVGHKMVYFQMVYVEKILVDHIRLFGGSENEVKMGFLWKWCQKKNCVLLSYLSVWPRFKVIYFILRLLVEGIWVKILTINNFLDRKKVEMLLGSSTETVAFQVYEILNTDLEFLQFFWLGSKI